MRVSRVRLINFANFSDVDVETGESIVIVGENKVGKSNFIRGLQLILDPGLSERDRQLGLEHFWDGLGEDKVGATIEVSVDLTDFTNDPRLMAHLNDCVIDPGPPMVARLTYRFQPKAGLGRAPESLKDYEYVIFGGNDPEMRIGGGLRRMLPIDVQVALRDAEKDLASWRNSPLRPLIEDLAASLDDDAREEIQNQVDQAQRELAGHEEVVATAERISERLIAIAGGQHAVPVSLGLAPTRVDALLRSVVSATTRPALSAAARALDRVLAHGHYSVPQYYGDAFLIGYRPRPFVLPAMVPPYYQPDTWAMSTWWASPSNQ